MIYRVITAERATGKIRSKADYGIKWRALNRAYEVEKYFPEIESFFYECESRDDKGVKVDWHELIEQES
jgi:hypothetical protein